MAAGCMIAGYAAMCYASQNSETSGNGRLQSTHQSSSEQGISTVLNGMSVVIWSLIAAKAKTGLDASQNG
jgi:hypothetical protein